MVEACPRIVCLACGGVVRGEEITPSLIMFTCIDPECGDAFVKVVQSMPAV